jgi:hypothetical protein
VKIAHEVARLDVIAAALLVLGSKGPLKHVVSRRPRLLLGQFVIHLYAQLLRQYSDVRLFHITDLHFPSFPIIQAAKTSSHSAANQACQMNKAVGLETEFTDALHLG